MIIQYCKVIEYRDLRDAKRIMSKKKKSPNRDLPIATPTLKIGNFVCVILKATSEKTYEAKS